LRAAWAPSGWRQFLPPPRRLEVTDGELAVLIVCTLVTTIGLAGDIARHLMNPGDLEGDFLSGWHLVLYGGVASVGAWIAWGAFRRGPSFVGSVPTTTIGFLTLTVGGAFDAVWHEVYGTEKAVEALVSPPHLVVFAGLVLLLTSPLVLLWPRPVDRLGLVASIAAVVSVVSALLVASLFTGFLSPMAGGLSLQAGYVEPLVGESLSEYDQVRGLGVVVWTAALVVAGFTPLLARFGVTRGLLGLGVATLGLPPVVLSGESSLPVLVSFVAAGIAMEVAVALWARPTLGRVAAPVTGALVAGVLWAASFWALEADGRMWWTPALRWGSVMIAAMIGAATAALVTLPVSRRPSPVAPVDLAGGEPTELAGTVTGGGPPASAGAVEPAVAGASNGHGGPVPHAVAEPVGAATHVPAREDRP
jgi:hypothetical protein